MAKVSSQKANKEYKCSKCGAVINKGDNYYKIIARFSSPKIRCSNCKPERSELTTSDYLSWLWDLQDHLEERYDFREEGAKDELYSEIEEMQSDLQDRFDNIPEQLQYADAGQTLQDRIDSLDSAMSDLDSLDYPCREDYEDEDLTDEEIDEEYENALEEYETEIAEIVGGIE